MRSHGTVLAVLKRVFVFIEDLGIGLSYMLTKHRDNLVTCLMVEGQQVHTKLIVDVLGHSLPFVVLFGSLIAILVVLNASGH